jgi:CRISPR-associated protein Csb2
MSTAPAPRPRERRVTTPGTIPRRSVFGECLTLRECPGPDGRTLGLSLTRTDDVAHALRGALMRYADDPPPAVLSGHFPDGRPLDRPHAAFLALPGPEAPDGNANIAAVAIVLPRDIEEQDRQAILLAAARWQQAGLRLVLGRHGVALLEPHLDDHGAAGLDAAWTAPSRHWASVTPVALDRNPGHLFARDRDTAAEATQRAEEAVARACERIGLPRPSTVRILRRSVFPTAPPAAAFMPFPHRGKGLNRVCVHVELEFDERVGGPVLLGVGRYFGVGLCRPAYRSHGHLARDRERLSEHRLITGGTHAAER